MRVAFYGRVSTDDAQDPSLSIPRQLGKCDEALSPISEKVSVTFWDVESRTEFDGDRFCWFPI
jgi:site-specific DNA recombinase